MEEKMIDIMRNPSAAIHVEGKAACRVMRFTPAELLFDMALILNLAYSIFYPVYAALHNYYHILVFAIMVLIFLSSKTLKFNALKTAGLAAFIIMSAIVIIINHSGLGLLIMSLWPLSIIYMFQKLSLSNEYLGRIHAVMSSGWIISVATTLTYNASFFENFQKKAEAGVVNPNTIAIILVFTCLFLVSYTDHTLKLKFRKPLIYCITLAALYRAQSRSSLLAFLAVILLEFCFAKRIKRSKKLAVMLIVTVIAAGIIFPFIYVSLYKNGIIAYNTLFLGKRVFTGRESIWLNLWNHMQSDKGAYIWGTGYTTELYSRGTFNLHNAYLMILAQYGTPLLIIYLSYLIHSVSHFFGHANRISDLQFKCYQVLLFVFIVGFGETTLTYLPNLIFIAAAIGIGCREKPGGVNI